MKLSLLPIFGLMALVSSCSGISKLTINSTSEFVYKTSNSVETESNLEMARLSLPGNLTLLEGILSEAPQNPEILGVLTKGYAAYAIGINGPDLLTSEYEQKEINNTKLQILKNFSKSFNYGLRYLKAKGIDWFEIRSSSKIQNHLFHFLDSKLTNSKLDLETLLITAQALNSLIGLQKENLKLTAELSIVKNVYDWVCVKNPNILYGACDTYLGGYEANRALAQKESLIKSKEIFEKAIRKHPHNWLIRINYIQECLLPSGDEENFVIQMNFLKEKFNEFNTYLIYPSEESRPEWSYEDHLRFLQAIALKKYEIIERFKFKIEHDFFTKESK